jgi:hypothetical protein
LKDLGLVGIAARFAEDLAIVHPECVATSGRRDIVAQANDMATNCIRSGQGSAWIARTYSPSVARGACILAVQNLTTPLTHDGVAEAIHEVLRTLTAADLAHLSRHLGGAAVDYDPKTVSPSARVWIDYQCRVRGGKVLWVESGLPMCHCEFPIP